MSQIILILSLISSTNFIDALTVQPEGHLCVRFFGRLNSR
jgi:hypothetical protein